MTWEILNFRLFIPSCCHTRNDYITGMFYKKNLHLFVQPNIALIVKAKM